MIIKVTSSLLLSIPFAYAQTQTLWGQCAGVTYKGPTECADGSFCTTYNPYYAQCIPAPTTITKTTTVTTPTSIPCPASTSRCTSTSLACPPVYTTLCVSYCATATPPPWPTSRLAKRCTSLGTRTSSTITTPTTTSACKSSTRCVAMTGPCGATSTTCQTYCASTTPPPIATPPQKMARCIASPPTTTSTATATTTTTSTCKSSTSCTYIPIPCGTAYTNYCRTFCATSTPPAMPTALLMERCMPPLITSTMTTAKP